MAKDGEVKGFNIRPFTDKSCDFSQAGNISR